MCNTTKGASPLKSYLWFQKFTSSPPICDPISGQFKRVHQICRPSPAKHATCVSSRENWVFPEWRVNLNPYQGKFEGRGRSIVLPMCVRQWFSSWQVCSTVIRERVCIIENYTAGRSGLEHVGVVFLHNCAKLVLILGEYFVTLILKLSAIKWE